jgi:hypothetical protein
MKNRLSFVPGIGLVVVAETYDPPPDLRYVTNGDQTLRIPGAETPNRSRSVWMDRGLLAIIAVGAVALITDGAFLWLAAWMIR